MVFNIVTEQTLESHDALSAQTPSTASQKANFHFTCHSVHFYLAVLLIVLFKNLTYHNNFIKLESTLIVSNSKDLIWSVYWFELLASEIMRVDCICSIRKFITSKFHNGPC